MNFNFLFKEQYLFYNVYHSTTTLSGKKKFEISNSNLFNFESDAPLGVLAAKEVVAKYCQNSKDKVGAPT